MNLFVILLIKAISCQTTDVKNILSLDSANFKGYLTASMIDYMEDRSYQLAADAGCMETPRETRKVAMHEMFDLIAGAETGVIIASSLLIKNDDAATMDQ